MSGAATSSLTLASPSPARRITDRPARYIEPEVRSTSPLVTDGRSFGVGRKR